MLNAPYQEGDAVNAWGHKFRWTCHHQTPEQYRHMKYSCDELADECTRVLDALGGSQEPLQETRQELQPHSSAKRKQKPDLYRLFKENHQAHPKLAKLWDEVTKIPSWVDWNQIARGQEVFYRYGTGTVTGLAFQSLLGGTGGSGHIAATLAKTGGFSLGSARKRLLETTQFVLQVTDSLDSIKPDGPGFESALRVRLLHAMVRRRVLDIAAKRPSYYAVDEFGIPINDADCIGTIAAFSASIIWQSLPRQGIYLREQEIEDYLALWRLVAHYMGTPTDVFSTPQKAKAVMETMLLYEYHPTRESRLLARNIILALTNVPPYYATRAFVEANTRWLNGNDLCDAIGINKPPLYYSILAVGQSLLLSAACYTSRIFPPLDRYQIKVFKRSIWAIVLEPKYSGLEALSLFDFKYIPGYRMQTEGEPANMRTVVFWTADRKALVMLLATIVMFTGMLSLLKAIVFRNWSTIAANLSEL